MWFHNSDDFKVTSKYNKIMRKYIQRRREVEAEPMLMGEAFERGIIGSREPSEGINEHGFLVRDMGYEWWVEEDIFNEEQMIAETFLDRMKIEDIELSERFDKLRIFINQEKFKELDKFMQAMLLVQYQKMNDYKDMLERRCECAENGTKFYGELSFGTAVELLERGFVVTRKWWEDGKFIIKQVPALIKEDVIPNMQSLPEIAKKLIMKRKKFIQYENQCLVYNQKTGNADSWTPTMEDIFAKDWLIVF